jgi:hypothetical protein
VEDLQEFSGRVAKKRFGSGTKSEHTAIVLETDQGDFVLRRPGANAFSDPSLDRLVGKTIRCRGRVLEYTLFLADWTELRGY